MRDLTPAAQEILLLLQCCEGQTRDGMNGPYAFDELAIRAIAQDLGFDTTGTDEFSEGALFWPRFHALAGEYFRIKAESRQMQLDPTRNV